VVVLGAGRRGVKVQTVFVFWRRALAVPHL
jgi:hypothetical protein